MQLLAEDKRSIIRSGFISIGAALLGLAIIVVLQHLLPEQDLSAAIAALVTAISGFIVNFVNRAVLKL